MRFNPGGCLLALAWVRVPRKRSIRWRAVGVLALTARYCFCGKDLHDGRKKDMSTQLSLFGGDLFRFSRPIRLVEFFAGYGSQSLAMDYLGLNYESWRICEWNWKSCIAYSLLHCRNSREDVSLGYTRKGVAGTIIGMGVSSDWSSPCSAEQIARMPEGRLREIFSAIRHTNNLVDISRVHAKDLFIEKEEGRKHDYVFTYSYPCQDYSSLGKQKLAHRGSGTRSSLLWEFERIMKELAAAKERPEVLLMENVPMAHRGKSKADFADWCHSLESMGYSNYWSDLSSDDYGVPQTRERCFMVSVLGNRQYVFPEKRKLTVFLPDLLERNVPEKYYLTPEQVHNISRWNNTGDRMHYMFRNGLEAKTITTFAGRNDYQCNYVIEKSGRVRRLTPRECWRLMGVKDEDFDRVNGRFSDTVLYHLAGDSIVVDVLKAIFGEMI